jgi:hypothetical protein
MSNTIITETNGIINNDSVDEQEHQEQPPILRQELVEAAKAATVTMRNMHSAHDADNIVKHFVKTLSSAGIPLSLAEPLVFDAIDALNKNACFRIGSEEGGDEPINHDESMAKMRRAYGIWLARAAKENANGDASSVPVSFLPIEPQPPEIPPSEIEIPSGKPPSKKKQTKKDRDFDVLNQVVAAAELWHSPDGKEYITITCRERKSSYSLGTGDVAKVLTYLCLEKKSHITQSNLNWFIAELQAKAAYQGPEYQASVRVAECDGKIYIDLANDDGEVIEVTKDGWEVTTATPLQVRFIRTAGMKALPKPVRSKEELLRLLMSLLNIDTRGTNGRITTRNAVLLAGVLIYSFTNRGPYPILAVSGEKGSAKTTFVESVKTIIDPSTTATRGLPEKQDDLMIAAANSHVLAYDNVSHISPWLADAFCRLSTGAGFGTRMHYSQSQEVLYHGRKPIILNSIGDISDRADLLDRAIILELPTVSGDKRLAIEEYWKRFDIALPLILGKVMDCLVCALRGYGQVKLKSLSRMADFEKFVSAAESTIPVADGGFQRAYAQNRENTSSIALSTPLVEAVEELVKYEDFEGTSTECLTRLNGCLGERITRSCDWPRISRVLSEQLKRLAPNLRELRIDVEFTRTGAKRLIRITKKRDGEGDDIQ